MSSSHLFLGLPIALLVLYLELRSGFHSAAWQLALQKVYDHERHCTELHHAKKSPTTNPP